MLLGIHGDGIEVKKRGKAKTVVAFNVCDFGLPAHLRQKKEFLHVSTLFPKRVGFSPNMNLVLLPLAEELGALERGEWSVFVDGEEKKVPIHT